MTKLLPLLLLCAASLSAQPLSLAASTFTLTGPSGGWFARPSADFSVAPDGLFTGTITITPAGGGLSTPVVLTFSNSADPQTFNITPVDVGPVVLTPSNDGSLKNPVALNYATNPGALTIGTATATSNSVSIPFTAPGDGGSAITSYTATCSPSGRGASTASPVTVYGLSPLTPYTCTVTAYNQFGPGAASSPLSNVTTPEPMISAYYTVDNGQALQVLQQQLSAATKVFNADKAAGNPTSADQAKIDAINTQILKSYVWMGIQEPLTLTIDQNGRPQLGAATLQTQINILQAQVAALRTQIGTSSNAKIAFFDTLNSVCVTCIGAINLAITNAKEAPGLYGQIICCGPVAVPPIPTGSQLIYLMPIDPSDPFQPLRDAH